MTRESSSAEHQALPHFLLSCIDKGILDIQTAIKIESFRKSSGLGLSRALREFVSPSTARKAALLWDPELLEETRFQPVILGSPPEESMTFDSLIPCQANIFPLEIARNIASRRGAFDIYNPFYVYSDIGLGKTHLLSAIANKAMPRYSTLLVNTADIEVELQRAEALDQRAELRQWLSSPDILLVDDIQLCEGKEGLQHELFAIFNQMTRKKQTVVISSDVPPTRLAGIERRLLSRLGSGVIVGLQMANKEERLELLKRFSNKEDETFSSDILNYLAEQVTDNVRRLKGVYKQLVAMQKHLSRPIDLKVARAVVPLPEDLEPNISKKKKKAKVKEYVESPSQAEVENDVASSSLEEIEETSLIRHDPVRSMDLPSFSNLTPPVPLPSVPKEEPSKEKMITTEFPNTPVVNTKAIVTPTPKIEEGEAPYSEQPTSEDAIEKQWAPDSLASPALHRLTRESSTAVRFDPVETPSGESESSSSFHRFKEMLADAESEEEENLALQIAISERLRQLREEGGKAETIKRVEKILALLREGKRDAVKPLIEPFVSS